jgi:hypothetical protein
MMKYADSTWGAYPDAKLKSLPSGLDLGGDAKTYSEINTRIGDFLYTEIVGFIIGTAELNEANWNALKNRLIAAGAEDGIAMYQAAYERYMAR